MCVRACAEDIAQGQQCLCLRNAPVMWPSWNGCVLPHSLLFSLSLPVSLSLPPFLHCLIPLFYFDYHSLFPSPFSLLQFTHIAKRTLFSSWEKKGSILNKENFWFWDESLRVDRHDNHLKAISMCTRRCKGRKGGEKQWKVKKSRIKDGD